MAQNLNSPSWRPKAIVFDLLTALLDSWSLWDASTPSGSPEEGRRWRKRYLELTFGAGAYAPATAYESLVEQSARDAGLPGSAPAALLRDWLQLRAWPEVARVLPGLRGEGYKLGVVTNCSAGLGGVAVRRAEECVGGGFRFDAAVTAEESGFYKPDRAAYEAVLPKLGVTVDDVLFVAGSAGDVQGATDAGMRVVWHNRVGLARKGDAVAMTEGKTLDEALRDFV
ncbi:putative 2-deoxyglucose-6-phosphate phosphatase [Diaporthe ampelina]|uniref:Putative 2-deoxyglucose-6-phosphate phosphatase n=1 Tax=Diaporthe ampelina TaxID=1214573 RepID=A0A0G2F506_9PEZI|nr:putative 2-deoxyglucose-6-phosphate phosphatase [Diaporthe ampelina]